MALPYPSMSFSPFAILTAEELNHMVANIAALAAGTGLDTGAVKTSKIDDGQVTFAKLAADAKPLTTRWSGWAASNFGTTETTLGSISFTLPAGYTKARISGAVRIQSQDNTQKDANIYIRDTTNNSIATHSAVYSGNTTFGGATCSIDDVLTYPSAGSKTVEMRAKTTGGGSANSNTGVVLITPVP